MDRHTDMDRIFNIDSGNGSIFTSKLLDRETLLWHNITVIATEISKSNLTQLSPRMVSPSEGFFKQGQSCSPHIEDPALHGLRERVLGERSATVVLLNVCWFTLTGDRNRESAAMWR